MGLVVAGRGPTDLNREVRRSVPARCAATAGFAAVEPVGGAANAEEANQKSVPVSPVTASAIRLEKTPVARALTRGLRGDVGTYPFPTHVPARRA